MTDTENTKTVNCSKGTLSLGRDNENNNVIQFLSRLKYAEGAKEV